MKKRIFSALLAIIMVLSVTGFNANVAAFDLPEGDEHMPAALIIGENVADISENSSGYNFSWTAEQNGTLTLEIISPDSWTYVVDNLTTSTYGDRQWSDSDPVVNPCSIGVEEGDELRIMVNTYDPYDMFNTPAETITLVASFEAEGDDIDDSVDTDELTQNEDGYYEIGTVSDFEAFATLVNGGEGDIDAVMTADIDISSTNVMIGEFSDFPYMGNFDGANHTLTMDYVIYDEYVAPFRFVESATIENLTVTGEIYTLSKFAAGLVGESKGDTVINNCISDVVINSQVYGDGTHGGLVGVNRESLTMTNCAFVGAMLGEDTDSTGGLVGWTDSDMSMTNCYVAASFETSEYNSNTFVRNYSPIVTLTNCYYINGCGDTRDAIYISSQAVSSGKLAYKLNGNSSDNAVFRQTIGEDEYPNFTGDIVYYNAEDDIYTNTPPAAYTITVDEDTLHGTVSAKGQAFAGETVTVTITADQDYMLSTLIVKNGDIYVPTDGNTFVMPAGNVTVSAIFKLRTELIIGENENTSTTIRMPFESGFCYSVCQYLVPAEKLELIRDKIITDISYFYDAVGDLALDQHVTVYVEEGGSFTNTGNYHPIDNATKIYEGTFDISAETMDIEELQLTLNTPFGYSGGDLLFTVFKQSSDYYDSIAFVSIPSDTASLYSLSDDVDFKNEGFEFADVRSNNVMPKMKFNIVSSDTYSITISDNIENGTVTFSSDSAFAGAKVSLVVTPDEGYIIDTVTYNDGSDHIITPENGVYSFTMPASDVTVSATFRIRESYSITVDDAISFGTVTAPESAFEETTVTLTVTPDAYCILETLTVMQGENVIDVSKDYTFSMPSGDVTVTATFNYPEIRVGGTRIDPTNASDVFGDGKVSYDVETRTLTLNNYTYIGEGVDIIEYGYDNTSAVIYSKNPINLFLIGENSLTHQMQDCNVSMVIYSEKGLTFSGSGSLDATACDAGINSYCIYSEKGDITFNSGTITALAGEAPTSYGVYSVYDINFNGGIVTAYGSHNALMASHIHLTDVELLEPVNGYINNRWVVDENGEYSEYAKIGPAEKYTISVSDDGNGTVSTNNVTSAIAGKKIHLDIQAEDGYGLDTLTVMQGDIPVEVAEDYTFTMPAGNVTVSATFRVLQSYTITVDEDIENGTITSPESAYEGSTVTLTVTPEVGYALSKLEVMQGDIPVEVTGDHTFVMPQGDVTISAVFKEKRDLIVGEDAEISEGDIPFCTFYEHSLVQYVIPADMLADANGTIFNGITYYYTPASSTTEDVTLTIYLQETTESSPGSNSFTSLEGAQKVYEGTNNLSTDMTALHELPLTFDNGYLYTGGNLLVTVFKSADDFFSRLKFPSISGFSKRALTDDDPYVAENITTYSSTLDGDIPKCKISFTSSTLYDITVDDSIENGTVTANTASSIMGSRITLNIAPAEGYVLDALTVMQGNVPVEVSEDYTFTMPDGNVTISATFRVAQSYAITVDENIENGTITSPESAYEGTTVTLTIEPNNKHVLETLSVMQGDLAVEVSDDYTFVMPSGNVTISATFKEMTELIIGENATQTGGVIPFRMYYKNAVSQYVIPSDMLKLIDGKLITDITYYYTPQSDSSTDITLSVYLSEMDIEDFTAQSFLPITGVQKAYEGTLSDLSTDPDNVHEMLLALDSPYYYNGGDLLVTVFKTADEYVTDFKFQSIEGVANHIYSDHDTYSLESLPNLSCHSSDLIPKTKLGFTDTTTYNITVADGIENGTVTTNVDVSIESGGVFVTVTPDEGYAVDTVSYNDGEEDHVITPENGLYYFEMPASDVTVSATFLALTRYAITVDENIGYGTIEVDESAYERSTVTVEITPDDGCVLLEFSVMQGETAIEVSDDYTFVMPDGDVTITAAFGYPLQIGGVTVTPDNASDIFGDGTAVYDAGENKLALNNYAYNGEPFKVHGDHNYDAVIAYSKTRPFTLVLSGDNSITVTKDTTSITGIFVSGDLTISGTGSLNIEASGESVTHAGAIRVLNGVTVSGVTLDASAGDASTISYGIHCDYDINISDATVKTSGGHAPNSAGLFSAHGKVKITGSAVTAESSDEAASHWAISAYDGIELGGVRIAEPSGAYVRNNSILNYDGTPVSDVSIVLTELFTLAGNLDVFEFDWDPGYSGNDLIWNNKTLKYEKTYENVAAGKYFFKIAKDHTWPGYGAKTEGEYIQNGVALELLKNSGDIGLYLPTDVKTLTFAFDPETLAVTVSWYNSITVGVDENGEPTHYSAAIPFYTFYLYSIAQHMLPAEMINTESGMIEALTWYYYQNDETLNRNIKVYLSEIEEDSVSDFVPIEESALVYEGNVTIEVVSDDYTEAKELYLKLDHPYEYNGKNLLVTVIDESVDDLYSSVAFLGIQNDVTSSTFRYDDFAGFTLDTLKNNMPIDSSSFVPMTKIDFKADAAIFFEGAQIRTSGEQGLRFVFSMAREYYDTLVHPTSVEQTGEGFGSVILPKFLIDGSLTKESEFAGVVPAVKLYEMTDTSVKFTVCLTQIFDYEREYSAVPYVTDSAGNTIYGELADGISVYEIAELCYADEKSDATLKEYLLTNILNAVDPEKYPIAE